MPSCISDYPTDGPSRLTVLMSNNAATSSLCTISSVMLAKEYLPELEVWCLPYLSTISTKTQLRLSRTQFTKRTRLVTCYPSLSKRTTFWLPRSTFSPSTQLRRKPVSLCKSPLIWPSRFKPAPRKPQPNTRPCVFSKKQTACCNVLRSRLRSKTRKLTKTSGSLRPRMRVSAPPVSPLLMPALKLRLIWSRLRPKLMRLNSSSIRNALRKMLIWN